MPVFEKIGEEYILTTKRTPFKKMAKLKGGNNKTFFVHYIESKKSYKNRKKITYIYVGFKIGRGLKIICPKELLGKKIRIKAEILN